MNHIEAIIRTELLAALPALDKDFLNSLFEIAGGGFALNNCRVLYDHKGTRGISILSSTFFTLWGVWNLFYYTALTQPLSFYGALFLTIVNFFYLGMMFYYRRASTPRQSWTTSPVDDHEVHLAPESVGYQHQLGDRL